MKATETGIIAVTENIEEAGAVLYWSLSGGLDADKFEAAWIAGGLDANLLPETPTPETALRRALNEQKQHRRLVRPIKGGWAVVDETDGAQGLEYRTRLTAHLNKIGHLRIDDPDDTDAEIIGADIATAYRRHQDMLTQNDISTWLVNMARKCQAVALRDRGGIYFIPHEALEHWRAMTGTLTDVSDHTCFEIPALKTEQAVDAILDAITREAEAVAADMEKELMEGDLKQRALQTRSRKCEEVMAKLNSYEKLLGKSLSTISDRVDTIQADLAAATLAQMAEL